MEERRISNGRKDNKVRSIGWKEEQVLEKEVDGGCPARLEGRRTVQENSHSAKKVMDEEVAGGGGNRHCKLGDGGNSNGDSKRVALFNRRFNSEEVSRTEKEKVVKMKGVVKPLAKVGNLDSAQPALPIVGEVVSSEPAPFIEKDEADISDGVRVGEIVVRTVRGQSGGSESRRGGGRTSCV
ncbi:unnamed protein product [Trifolium pratense]|uniref:Uncharacterized protein n=1 Tax=Trifolium pratense TaxID=57577 RepID=A0ACB0IAR4_TRIPR|nr:unnamed protein product [Trifolium pratense]